MAFTRVVKDCLDSVFGFSAGWTDTTAWWGALGTGHVKYANGGGAVCTVTLPANHGYTGGAMLGYSLHGLGSANPIIDVDGTVVQSPWNLKTGNYITTFVPSLFTPRVVSYGFVLNPAKPASATQLIHTTAGADGFYTVIVGIELYTAAAPVAGRVGRTGHSMFYCVLSSVSKGPNPNTAGLQFTAHLNNEKYLGQSWTDYNTCVPSEDLCEGSNSSGLAGGPNSAGAYAQFTNVVPYDNISILTPGWMRHEACASWPNTGGHAPRLGTGLFTTDADYMAGLAQWAGSMFQEGLYGHNVNDAGFLQLLDAPPAGNPLNALSATGQSDITATGNWASGTGTWTITTPLLAGGTGTTANIAQNADLALVNTRLAAIGSMYYASTATHLTGSLFQANADKVSLAAIGNPPSTPTLNIGGAIGGAGTIAIATVVTGRNQTPAGPGYALKRFIDRFRADLVRPLLAITPAPRIGILGCPNVNGGGPPVPVVYPGSGSNVGAYEQIDNAMKSVLDEPWIRAVTGGTNPFYFVPLRAATTGYDSTVSQGDFHPSDHGNAGILKAILDAREQSAPGYMVPTGAYRGGISS